MTLGVFLIPAKRKPSGPLFPLVLPDVNIYNAISRVRAQIVKAYSRGNHQPYDRLGGGLAAALDHA